MPLGVRTPHLTGLGLAAGHVWRRRGPVEQRPRRRVQTSTSNTAPPLRQSPHVIVSVPSSQHAVAAGGGPSSTAVVDSTPTAGHSTGSTGSTGSTPTNGGSSSGATTTAGVLPSKPGASAALAILPVEQASKANAANVAPPSSAAPAIVDTQPTAAPASAPSSTQMPAAPSAQMPASSSAQMPASSSAQMPASSPAQMPAPPAAQAPSRPPASPSGAPSFSIKGVYVVVFGVIFLGGLLFASMSLQLTSNVGFGDALTRVMRRIARSIAFRQLLVIAVAIFLVRFALNNVLKFLAQWSSSPVQWDKSRLYYVMKEVYSPLELLLFIAGCCTIADSFVPQLISVPKTTVTHVVRTVLSMSFVAGAATVVYNLKSRFCKEQAWQCEMQGDLTSQRRWEAYDKLGTFAIYGVGVILGIQALGLEVRSVLAIGGIGGLAIGLAGREICENLLNGFLIMTTMPFEVGDEVAFRPNGYQSVEGIVIDVGWYRTCIRSFEREMYVIPNSVFSKCTVLNVSRKAKEWRLHESLSVRVQDVHKVNAIIQDIRRIVRNDNRIINKLHRRVFLDRLTQHDVQVYVSFYVEASNRDAFMSVKQDLLLAFVDCIERNGAKLATPRTVLDVDETLAPGMGGLMAAAAAGAYSLQRLQLPVSVDITASPAQATTSMDGGSTAAADAADTRAGGGSNNFSAGGGSSGGSGGASAAAASGGSTGLSSKPADGTAAQQQSAGGSASAAASGAGSAAAPAPSTRSKGDGAGEGRHQPFKSAVRSILQALFAE